MKNGFFPLASFLWKVRTTVSPAPGPAPCLHHTCVPSDRDLQDSCTPSDRGSKPGARPVPEGRRGVTLGGSRSAPCVLGASSTEANVVCATRTESLAFRFEEFSFM